MRFAVICYCTTKNLLLPFSLLLNEMAHFPERVRCWHGVFSENRWDMSLLGHIPRVFVAFYYA